VASRLDGPMDCVDKAPTPLNFARLDPDSLAAILTVQLVRLVEGVHDEGLRQLAETMADDT